MGRKRDLSELLDVAKEERTSLAAVTRNLKLCLQRRLVSDDLVCPAYNLYERRSTWEDLKPDERAVHVIRGLAALHPTWTFCRTSAALILGLRVPYSCTHEIHVLTTGGRRALDQDRVPPHALAEAAPSVAFHARAQSSKSTERLPEPVRVDGVSVTSDDETVLDCLQAFRLTDSLVVADSYLAKTRKSSAELVDLLQRHRVGCKGIGQALRTASFADPRPESGGESYARARMIELGYEVPDLQVKIYDQLTCSYLRPDFLWRLPNGLRIAGEFDGLGKYIDPAMTQGHTTAEILVRQNLRDTRLGLYVDSIVHFTEDIVRNDFQFCALLDAYSVPYRS